MVIQKTYDYDEAIDAVLALRDNLGHMPLEDDYVRGKLDVDMLLSVLGAREEQDMWEVVTKAHARPYAGVNILVLQELRRRNDEEVYIGKNSGYSWDDYTSNIFHPRY